MTQYVQNAPKLLKYWDFEYNDYLDIETTRINSKIQAHWRCPSCLYSWEDSILKTYNRSKKMVNFCPCCSLGEVLIEEKNSILVVYPNITQYLNFHFENQVDIVEVLKSEKFNSKRSFHLKCPTCHVGWKGIAINHRLFQTEEKELFHIGCNEWNSRFYYNEVYPNLKKIYSLDNKISFNDLTLSDNVTIPYYWKCDNCHHDFKMSIDTLFNRILNKNYYCSECKTSFDKPIDIVLEEYPLSFLKPNDLVEWSENNSVTKDQVDSLSNIAINWRCTSCHGEYTCTVINKNEHSCPYCENIEMLSGFNTLEITHPYLQKFWNPNHQRNLVNFWKNSQEIITWICPCCQIEFQCSPIEMISRTDLNNQNFQTCPNMCDWIEEVFNNDILSEYPVLVAEWSPKNNIPIHFALTHIETKKYWWCCSTCHGDYQCSIPIRKELSNTCPYCNHMEPLREFNTLLDVYPDLAKMWSPKNSVSLDTVVPNDTDKRLTNWYCKDCDLDFQEYINVVLHNYLKNGESTANICPYCDKRLPDPRTESLNIVKPYLVDEWISELHGDITKEFSDADKFVKWRCRTCHGEFEAQIYRRKENDDCCPYCKGDKLLPGFNTFAAKYPTTLLEWDYLNNILLANPDEISAQSNTRVWWICKNDNEHRYKMSVRRKRNFEKRKKEPCIICKGLRRKREHFVPYKSI